MVHAIATASIFQTEDPEKVRRALLNLFPSAEVMEREGEMTASTDDLSRFKELIRNHRILDSTRRVLLDGLADGKTSFLLNKQAAFVGKVSFAEGKSPMGPMTVVITAEDMEKAIDDIAPRTVDGEVP